MLPLASCQSLIRKHLISHAVQWYNTLNYTNLSLNLIPNFQVCCNGVLYNPQPGHQCCEEKYIPYVLNSTGVCCGGQIREALPGYQCCSGYYVRILPGKGPFQVYSVILGTSKSKLMSENYFKHLPNKN